MDSASNTLKILVALLWWYMVVQVRSWDACAHSTKSEPQVHAHPLHAVTITRASLAYVPGPRPQACRAQAMRHSRSRLFNVARRKRFEFL